MQNKAFIPVENILTFSQNLEHGLQKLRSKINHHEDNMRLLNTQINKIDESILDMQVTLEKYHSSNVAEEGQSSNHQQTEEQTVGRILKQDKTAAAVVCSIKNHHAILSSKLPFTKDMLGVVATLGKVNDDNISRLLAEYVGLETMLAIVCKTYESVKALEEYEKNGVINKSAGLHGLGASIGRILDGRFLVICLENLRTYTGEFVADDPQRRLALLTPRLPSGECPPGFLGFAVNMIHVDPKYLSCLTANGHGLRETLFYSLFSNLQVYRTRAEMQHAIPCISDGAISLDGGIIKRTGFFSLGDREEVEVSFPINSGVSNIPVNIMETEEELKLMHWKKERHIEDMRREEALCNHARMTFNIKKEELRQHVRESSRYMAKRHTAAQYSRRPREGAFSSRASLPLTNEVVEGLQAATRRAEERHTEMEEVKEQLMRETERANAEATRAAMAEQLLENLRRTHLVDPSEFEKVKSEANYLRGQMEVLERMAGQVPELMKANASLVAKAKQLEKYVEHIHEKVKRKREGRASLVRSDEFSTADMRDSHRPSVDMRDSHRPSVSRRMSFSRFRPKAPEEDKEQPKGNGGEGGGEH